MTDLPRRSALRRARRRPEAPCGAGRSAPGSAFWAQDGRDADLVEWLVQPFCDGRVSSSVELRRPDQLRVGSERPPTSWPSPDAGAGEPLRRRDLPGGIKSTEDGLIDMAADRPGHHRGCGRRRPSSRRTGPIRPSMSTAGPLGRPLRRHRVLVLRGGVNVHFRSGTSTTSKAPDRTWRSRPWPPARSRSRSASRPRDPLPSQCCWPGSTTGCCSSRLPSRPTFVS